MSASAAAAAELIGSNTFEECMSKQQLQGESLLQCISSVLQKQQQTELYLIEQNATSNRNTTILLMAALVFFMQAGFAMVCAGSVRRKNLQNTMLKNILDACGATIAFWSIGYAIAFGESGGGGDDGSNTFIGSTDFFLWNIQDENIVFWVFQYTFSAASATIVAGSLAERCQMTAYFYYSVMLTGWVYPVIVHAVWSTQGFLSPISAKPLFGVGMLDCAGGAVVHVTGGFTVRFFIIIFIEVGDGGGVPYVGDQSLACSAQNRFFSFFSLSDELPFL